MTTIDLEQPLTPLDEQRLDAALGDNFEATALPSGEFEVICSGCDTYVVDDIEQAVALIDAHRARHDQEARS